MGSLLLASAYAESVRVLHSPVLAVVHAEGVLVLNSLLLMVAIATPPLDTE